MFSQRSAEQLPANNSRGGIPLADKARTSRPIRRDGKGKEQKSWSSEGERLRSVRAQDVISGRQGTMIGPLNLTSTPNCQSGMKRDMVVINKRGH